MRDGRLQGPLSSADRPYSCEPKGERRDAHRRRLKVDGRFQTPHLLRGVPHLNDLTAGEFSGTSRPEAKFRADFLEESVHGT
jgi:hypothetical protein